jgi:archaemetzincin
VPILILNGSAVRESDLRKIAAAVQNVFAAPVEVASARLNLRRAFDPSRNQSNSTALLAQVLTSAEDSEYKRIAVVDVDLFIPVLTFVFGEAQLNGTAAIVSTHRLMNQFYGLPPDPKLLLHRLEKEIVHEVGHTFGLYHCRYFECVMRSSTYVEEIDMKKATMCAGCAGILGNLETTGAGNREPEEKMRN